MGFGVQTEPGAECFFCLGIIGMKCRSEINLAFFGSKSLYLGQPRGEENSGVQLPADDATEAKTFYGASADAVAHEVAELLNRSIS